MFLRISNNLRNLFHIILSFSLLEAGEYSTTLFVQLVFLLSLFSFKKSFYFIYLPVVHYALLKIFASGNYLIYFFDLFIISYMLQSGKTKLNINEIYIFALYITVLFMSYIYLQESIYDIYIMLDINDRVNYIGSEVSYALSLVHILILFFIEFKKN